MIASRLGRKRCQLHCCCGRLGRGAFHVFAMVEEKSLSLCGVATEPQGLGCSESPRWESLLGLSLSEDEKKKNQKLLTALQATEGMPMCEAT